MEKRRTRTVTAINGRIVTRQKATISVFDNALLYAEGLFETFLAVEDGIVFRDDHLRRLYQGARVIGLRIPVNRSTLSRWMAEAVRAHPERIKKVRLTVTGGESARWVGTQGEPQVIVAVAPHSLPEKPFSLLVSEFRVDQKSVFRRIKTISYGIHAAALQKARYRHCDDALLLNENNHIAEVTSANIFWVRRGRIYTPSMASGCLDGVTRRIVFREAKELGLSVVEKDETLSRMLTADEVFVASSLKPVIGVSRILDGDRVHRIAEGPITRRLLTHFRNLVGV